MARFLLQVNGARETSSYAREVGTTKDERTVYRLSRCVGQGPTYKEHGRVEAWKLYQY